MRSSEPGSNAETVIDHNEDLVEITKNYISGLTVGASSLYSLEKQAQIQSIFETALCSTFH